MGSDTEGSNTLASRTLGSSSPEPVTIGIDTMLLSVADNNCLIINLKERTIAYADILSI